MSPADGHQKWNDSRFSSIVKLLMVAVFVLCSQPANAAEAAADPQWYGPDKALHFVAGFALSAGGYGLGSAVFDHRWQAALLGAGISIGAGATKEGLDAAGLGTPSWEDFAWDVLGGALGLGVAVTFDVALRGPQP